CVLERVHAVVTRVLRRKLAEHRLDQEIGFKIVREQRAGITGEDRDKHREKPRLSLPGFGRKACRTMYCAEFGDGSASVRQLLLRFPKWVDESAAGSRK